MPELPIADEKGNLKNDAAIVLQSFMHFPGFKRLRPEIAKDPQKKLALRAEEEKQRERASYSRQRYVNYLESRQLILSLRKKTHLMIGPDHLIDLLSSDLDEEEFEANVRYKLSERQIHALYRGRDFGEIEIDPVRFYKQAFFASHCLYFYAYHIKRGAQSEKIKFNAWKTFMQERFVSNLEQQDMKISVRKPWIKSSEWASAGNAFEVALDRFTPVLHLWCACLINERFTSLLLKPMARGTKDIGSFFDRSGGYDVFRRLISTRILADARDYQRIMLGGHKRNLQSQGKGKEVNAGPWIEPERMWLIPENLTLPERRIREGQNRNALLDFD